MPSSDLYNATPPPQAQHPHLPPNPTPIPVASPSLRISAPRQSPIPGPSAASDPNAPTRALHPQNPAVPGGQPLPAPPSLPNQHYSPKQLPNLRRQGGGRLRDLIVDILEDVRGYDGIHNSWSDEDRGRRRGRFHRPPFVWHYSWRGNGRRGQGVLGEVVDEILDVLGEGRGGEGRGGRERNGDSGREGLDTKGRSRAPGISTSTVSGTGVQVNGAGTRRTGDGEGGVEGNNGENGGGGSGIRRPYGTYNDGVYSRPSRPMIQR